MIAVEIEHKKTDQVFSYYHADKLLHFNVTLLARLRDAVPQMFRRITLGVGAAEYDLCIQHRGIEEPKVSALTNGQANEPGYGVFFADDDSFSIVDGHHRLVRRYRDGAREMAFYVTTQSLWQHCLIEYPEEANRQIAAGLPPKVENPEHIIMGARLET